jgi:hypothetical protein
MLPLVREGRQPTIPLHPPGISEAIEFIPAIEPLC